MLTPLGRGLAGWYSGPSERDVLDALNDTEAAYQVDTRQEIISGYSMGGYGTYRLAELHPDRFAGFIDWVGYTDCLNGTPLAGLCPVAGADANPIDYVRNLRWVPGGMLYSGADALVWAPSAIAMQQAFATTGYRY
ncbi:prolyl oligopeptidase family serine peptidase [Amycolatopsis sp. NPDC051045]|uniref:prolyl oligopeptidase family serine peptidase n=1 Tax=Amycolatopsis sp. NPDC051045 TaxID=3156922 RepID=UPI00341C42A4